MASTSKTDGQVITAWMPAPLVQRLREQAARDERSISQTVMRAVRSQLDDARR